MAMQSGVGLSKILIFAGAGYTGSILLNNGKLSAVLGELQALVKGLEKSGDGSDGDTDVSDAVAAQVRRLAMEVRQLASSRQITVLNGGSGGSIASSLVLPAATVGALGYGYMWWKGISFSDLMYVTKRNMANAVSNLTKHLENVTEALSAAKRHLTQRIQNLDDKMEKQNVLSKEIQENVTLAREDLSAIEGDLEQLQNMIAGLDGKIGSLEYKQDIANIGVAYLCNFVTGKKMKIPEILVKEKLQLSGNSRARHLLADIDTPSRQGLKAISDGLKSVNEPGTDAGHQNGDEKPRSLMRTSSARS